MRMEELSKSRYEKNPDTVERYLLNLVQEYFKNNSNLASANSREFIIQKAVKRMKEEIQFEGIGVLSIMTPNDTTPRTGAVTISLEDLNGEPLIAPKFSAFNVPFGDKANTACEGNDPRLSDKRVPLDHQHTMDEINGLEGCLSTLKDMLERINDFQHEHNNKRILDMITYTGKKTSIDLADIEGIEEKVRKMCDEIEKNISTYEKESSDKIAQVTDEVNRVKEEIDKLKLFIEEENKKALEQAKQYSDVEIDKAKQVILEELNSKYKLKSEMTELLNHINKTFTLVDSFEVVLNTINISGNITTYSTKIPDEIMTELKDNRDIYELTPDKAIIDFELEYTMHDTGVTSKTGLPYVGIKSNEVTNVVKAAFDKSGNITIKIERMIDETLIEVANSKIICNVYAIPKQFTLP